MTSHQARTCKKISRKMLELSLSFCSATVGFWQLGRAIKHIWKLKQSLIYLVGYFLLGDALNTTVTVIATLSYQIVAYDTLTLTYVLIVGIVAQAIGIGAFWLAQKRWQLSTKTMFNAIMLGIILL